MQEPNTPRTTQAAGMSKAQFPWQFKMGWSKVPDLKVKVRALDSIPNTKAATTRPRRTQANRGERFPILPSIMPEKPASPPPSGYSWAEVVEWPFGTWFKTPLQRAEESYAKKVKLQQPMIEQFLELGRGPKKIPHEKIIDETGLESFGFERLQNYLRMSSRNKQTYDQLRKCLESSKRQDQLQQEFCREPQQDLAELQTDKLMFQKERNEIEVEKKMYKLQTLQRGFLLQQGKRKHQEQQSELKGEKLVLREQAAETQHQGQKLQDRPFAVQQKEQTCKVLGQEKDDKHKSDLHAAKQKPLMCSQALETWNSGLQSYDEALQLNKEIVENGNEGRQRSKAEQHKGAEEHQNANDELQHDKEKDSLEKSRSELQKQQAELRIIGMELDFESLLQELQNCICDMQSQEHHLESDDQDPVRSMREFGEEVLERPLLGYASPLII